MFYISSTPKPMQESIFRTSTETFRKAGKTIWWLLKIIIPVSLIVSLLQYWGVIAYIAKFLAPSFSHFGLPGESAIVFISSIFLPLYGPIAIITTLALDIREITILAIMCLISHNLIVETAIQRKTGSSPYIMFSVRIITSLLSAYILNLLLPHNLGASQVVTQSETYSSVWLMLQNWLYTTLKLSLKITLIITGLLFLQNILKAFKVLDFLSGILSPVMKLMGLSGDSSFLWLVAQTLGLAYGSVVMIEEVERKAILPQNANLLNYHIAVNHSLLEDTLLFVAIGVPASWIIAPRFFFSIIIVWSVRLLSKLIKKKNTRIILTKT